MKKAVLVCLVALLGMGTSAKAQNAEKTIVGVWQQYVSRQSKEGTTTLILAPVWKMISDDGKFCVMAQTNAEFNTIITTHGTYQMKSDSICVEKVAFSAFSKQLEGKDNELTCKLLNPNIMTISYKTTDGAGQAYELWKRVKPEELKR